MPVLEDFAVQGPAVQGLISGLHHGTGIHAYLFSGPEGVGKRTLARLTAQYRLCSGDKKPCGVCPSCIQFLAGSHPDFMVVQPGVRLDPYSDKKSKQIIVQDIRILIEQANQNAYEGSIRVFLIEDCEKMNPNAANALLKTLEEPSGDVLFLLTTDKPQALLPTIISRCRCIHMHPWENQTVRRVLQAKGDIPNDRIEAAVSAASGSIGRALSLAADENYWQRRSEVLHDFFSIRQYSDILPVSNQWKDRKDDAAVLLDDLEEMIRALMLVWTGMADDSTIAAYPVEWQRMAHEASADHFTSLFECIREGRWMRQNNVTLQAVLEQILLRMMEEIKQWQK